MPRIRKIVLMCILITYLSPVSEATKVHTSVEEDNFLREFSRSQDVGSDLDISSTRKQDFRKMLKGIGQFKRHSIKRFKRMENTKDVTSTLDPLDIFFSDYTSVRAQNVTETSAVDNVTLHITAQKWKKVEDILSNLMVAMNKKIVPIALRSSGDLDLSPGCMKGLMEVLTGMKYLKLWAFKMFDASGKLSSGRIMGTINSLGDYDECLSVNVSGHFQGQYCVIDMYPPLPERRRFTSSFSEIPEFINISHPDSVMTEILRNSNSFYSTNIRTSVCVPSTCTREEVQKIANKVSQKTEVGYEVVVPHCEILKEKVELNPDEIVIVIILGTLLLLGVTSTIMDVFLKLRSKEDDHRESLSLPSKYILCFSFYANAQRLLKPDTSTESIKIFHGMRTITILWVILIHTYGFMNFHTFGSTLNVAEFNKLAFQIVSNGSFCVETFFFISSVLISYGVMKMKAEKISVSLYIFRRIWRLTPPIMLVIACVFLIPHLGSGPVWKETVVDPLTEKCRANWWANLIYINNFIGNENMCLQWLWYVAVDTQLYILSLIVIIPLKRNPRLAFAMNLLIFVCGIVISAALHVYYRLPPLFVHVYGHPEDKNYLLDKGHMMTYLHSSAYCIGLAVGYFLATKPPKLHISLKVNVALWLSSFIFSLVVIYGVHDWNQGNVPNMAVSVLYACTNKLVWLLAIAWVTIACMTGNGGIVTTILSWPAFVPLGRLTYMTYLIHLIIHMINIGNTRTVMFTGHRTIVYLYLGNVLLSFMCACGLSLLFESPFMALEKLMFSGLASKYKNSSDENVEERKLIKDRYMPLK